MVNANIWGKTLEVDGVEKYYPLIGHLLDTATVSGVLWDKWLNQNLKSFIEEDLGAQSKNFLQLLSGIHDLGKCSPIFQGQMLSGRFARPEIQQKLTYEGFEFPEITAEAEYRKQKIHRHEKIGAYLLTKDRVPTLSGKEQKQSPASKCWVDLVVLGHHGSYALSYDKKSLTYQIFESLMKDKWVIEQQKIIDALSEACGVTLEEAFKIDSVRDETIILLTGMVILSDRIASCDDSVRDGYFKLLVGELSIDKPGDWLRVRREVLEGLVKSSVGFSDQITKKDILGDFEPRGIQKNIPKDRGLWLCMAPTGAGKTEAALLRHSLENERLIFLLPTLSTTNAMMSRIEKIYENKKATTAVLGHGLAFLEDFYNNRNRNEQDRENIDDCGLYPNLEFSKVRGAKLSAVVNIATIDQLLMASFPIKWTALKWTLIANSHIIIDEAHLLDHYQIELLKPILTFCGIVNSRVSILSATLPNWLESKMINQYTYENLDGEETTSFPSSVSVNSIHEIHVDKEIEVTPYRARISVEKSKDTITSHIDWAKKALAENPKARLGIFVNQVRFAQTIALELQRSLPDDVTVIALHSRMLAKHRKKVTDWLTTELKTRTGKAERIILVGTQVIEMSLDIDLDLISTDICPAPSLIQRLGRAWRDKDSITRFDRISKEKYPELTAHIVVPVDSDDKISKGDVLPYMKSVIERTYEFLEYKNFLNFPKDIQSFVETSVLDLNKSLLAELENSEDEYASYIYRTMKGKNAAISITDLVEAFNIHQTMLVRDYQNLTDSEMTDDIATRLVETPQGEPFVISSSDRDLIELGALPETVTLEKANVRQLQSASVSVSSRQSELLLEDPNVQILEIEKLNKWRGYFGKLPEYLVYDKLVGLMEI